MKILVADDDPVSRRLLEAIFAKWGHETVLVNDGLEALTVLEQGGIRMAIVDWEMPHLNGLEVCKVIRSKEEDHYTYIILLTARKGHLDLFEGLSAGADDYVGKPFDPRELDVRVKVGLRTLDLEDKLAGRISELEEAIDKIQTLEGLLPVCCYCHKIRDDDNYWQKVDTYMRAKTKMKVSHGICPPCYEKFVQPELDAIKPDNEE